MAQNETAESYAAVGPRCPCGYMFLSHSHLQWLETCDRCDGRMRIGMTPSPLGNPQVHSHIPYDLAIPRNHIIYPKSPPQKIQQRNLAYEVSQLECNLSVRRLNHPLPVNAINHSQFSASMNPVMLRRKSGSEECKQNEQVPIIEHINIMGSKSHPLRPRRTGFKDMSSLLNANT